MRTSGEDGGKQNGEKHRSETGESDPHALHACFLPRAVHCEAG
jgi:hypothetical protein